MNKKLIWGIVIAVVVIGAVVAYVRQGIPEFGGERKLKQYEQYMKINSISDWKTYTHPNQGYSFQYPTKLSLGTASGSVNLSHAIPFENRDGGCDMMGDAELSTTLTDFSVQFEVLPGEVKPPYVDGPYSAGQLNGNYAYMGAEGCGQTKYYFPVSGNKTLVVTKNELQVLSPVVSAEVRNQVLAVPGVISYEEANIILKDMLSSFKFTSAECPKGQVYIGTTCGTPEPGTTNPSMSGGKYPELVVITPNGGEKISYGSIYMAGDLNFSWKKLVGAYKPTSEFAAYLIDESGNVVRNDFIRSYSNNGSGVYSTSFPGEAKIQVNKNYKIKVCDEVDLRVVKCDESDNYFTITN